MNTYSNPRHSSASKAIEARVESNNLQNKLMTISPVPNSRKSAFRTLVEQSVAIHPEVSNSLFPIHAAHLVSLRK